MAAAAQVVSNVLRQNNDHQPTQRQSMQSPRQRRDSTDTEDSDDSETEDSPPTKKKVRETPLIAHLINSSHFSLHLLQDVPSLRVVVIMSPLLLGPLKNHLHLVHRSDDPLLLIQYPKSSPQQQQQNHQSRNREQENRNLKQRIPLQ